MPAFRRGAKPAFWGGGAFAPRKKIVKNGVSCYTTPNRRKLELSGGRYGEKGRAYTVPAGGRAAERGGRAGVWADHHGLPGGGAGGGAALRSGAGGEHGAVLEPDERAELCAANRDRRADPAGTGPRGARFGRPPGASTPSRPSGRGPCGTGCSAPKRAKTFCPCLHTAAR